MSRRQARVSVGVLGAICAIGIAFWFNHAFAQQVNPKPAEQLHPAKTLLFFQQDGSATHKAAWEKTAAFEAIHGSGLVDVFSKVLSAVQDMAPNEQSELIRGIFEHVQENGVSLSLGLADNGPPIPMATVVFPGAAKFSRGIGGYVRDFAAENDVEFEDVMIRGRSVIRGQIPDSPGVEVGWWNEGTDLVLVAGINATSAAVGVAAGDNDNLSTNPVWAKYRSSSDDFERTTTFWLDFAAVREIYGAFPVPIRDDQPSVPISKLLEVAGLDRVGVFSYLSGYRGRALWSEGGVEHSGPYRGLMSFYDQKPMTLDDLPPVPHSSAFFVSRFDLAKAWSDTLTLVDDGAAFGPPEAREEVREFIEAIPGQVGFDPLTDLLEPLGDIMTVFSDENQGFMGLGLGVAVSVDDAPKLARTTGKLLRMAQEASNGAFEVATTERAGRSILQFSFESFQGLGLTVDKDWMVFGLTPQTVEAFFLRADGKLPSWKPTGAEVTSLAQLDQQFTGFSRTDPRTSWSFLLKVAPLVMSFARTGLTEAGVDVEIPINVADIPPAELVVRPLFPNLATGYANERGIHWKTRQSLPGVPLLGGMGEGSSVATVAIGTALLLPAIQQAREAARRTQSKIHLKQIGLAMHNYHSAWKHFPVGTIPNDELKPEERLSWLTSLLPYLEENDLYDRLDTKQAWNSKAQSAAQYRQVDVFRHPANDGPPGRWPVVDYVGMAGLGKDAPNLPVSSPRAGVFGYNRKVRFRDLVDGASNTMAVTEASDNTGPWLQGGPSTIRPLTKRPYVNGPDGIGGPSPGGINVLMADGSVRFVSEDVDPKLFERLITINDGNPVELP